MDHKAVRSGRGLYLHYFAALLCWHSLRADFTMVEEFEGEKEKVKSAHSLQLFRSRDKSYPPSLLYKDQSRPVFDFAKVLFSLTLHLIR